MSNAFSDFDAAILEFMQEMGTTATYVQQITGSYDPATGTNAVVNAEIPVQIIIMDILLTSGGLATKYGTTIEAGDKEIYVRPPNKTDPLRLPLVVNAASDVILSNNIRYKIVAMKEVNTTGADPVLFCFHCRR